MPFDGSCCHILSLPLDIPAGGGDLSISVIINITYIYDRLTSASPDSLHIKYDIIHNYDESVDF